MEKDDTITTYQLKVILIDIRDDAITLRDAEQAITRLFDIDERALQAGFVRP